MSFHHSAILLCFGLGTLTLTSCGEDGDGGGAGGGGSAEVCNTDFSNAAAGEPISLRTDLMPIFGLSCTAGQCHNDAEKKADLYLGVRCAFDEAAKWKCTFPAEVNADPTKPQPLTDEVVNLVHAGLVRASKTAPAAQLVTPGDPDASFFLDKLLDRHNDKGLACTKQDPRSVGECGDLMPLNSSFCTKQSTTGPSKVAAVAAWIAQGAKNN